MSWCYPSWNLNQVPAFWSWKYGWQNPCGGFGRNENRIKHQSDKWMLRIRKAKMIRWTSHSPKDVWVSTTKASIAFRSKPHKFQFMSSDHQNHSITPRLLLCSGFPPNEVWHEVSRDQSVQKPWQRWPNMAGTQPAWSWFFPVGGCRLAWCSPGHVKNDPGPLQVWWYTVKQLNSKHCFSKAVFSSTKAQRAAWWTAHGRPCPVVHVEKMHSNQPRSHPWLRGGMQLRSGIWRSQFLKTEDPRDKPWDLQTYQKSSFSLHEYINASANAKS